MFVNVRFRPSLINIDKSGTNKSAIKAYNREKKTRIKIRQCKYLNNIVEQDHRFVKRKMRQMLGFKTLDSAQATIAGLEMWRMIKKGQRRWSGSLTPVDQFWGLSPNGTKNRAKQNNVLSGNLKHRIFSVVVFLNEFSCVFSLKKA